MNPQGRRTSAERSLRLFPAWQAGAHLHLVANTLGTVGALLRRRPEAAEDLLAQFASYLRDLLHERRPLVPLADEVSMILALVGVERARMGGRLRFETDCPPDVLEIAVPPLILHPLVENAIRHGIAHRVHGGRLRLSARMAGTVAHLAVSDDGPGFLRPLPARLRAGWGLTSVRLRLAAVWGPAARLRVLARPGQGTLAALTIPAVTVPTVHAPRRTFGVVP